MARMNKHNNLPRVESSVIKTPLPGSATQEIIINGKTHEYDIYTSVDNIIIDLFNYYYLTVSDIKFIRLMW